LARPALRRSPPSLFAAHASSGADHCGKAGQQPPPPSLAPLCTRQPRPLQHAYTRPTSPQDALRMPAHAKSRRSSQRSSARLSDPASRPAPHQPAQSYKRAPRARQGTHNLTRNLLDILTWYPSSSFEPAGDTLPIVHRPAAVLFWRTRPPPTTLLALGDEEDDSPSPGHHLVGPFFLSTSPSPRSTARPPFGPRKPKPPKPPPVLYLLEVDKKTLLHRHLPSPTLADPSGEPPSSALSLTSLSLSRPGRSGEDSPRPLDPI
jgi:hypothetical protein